MFKIFKEINWLTFSVLVFYPFLLLALFIHYNSYHDLGVFELCLFIAGYYGSNIAVGVGLHRLWSHNSFKTNKYVEFILALMSAGTLQGPVLSWASNHYKHHTFTDEPQDPHSPLRFQNPVLGFLWAHIGWMLFGEGSYKSIDRLTMIKHGKNKILKWQLKYYWQLAVFMNVLLPMIVGFCFGGDLLSCYIGFLFIGLGRALQQNATFCVNSLCHFVGSRTYYHGTARDIWWMAPFILGENWHNYHHAFPSDYRNGIKFYQFDVHKWIIFLMYKLGLAYDLNVTSDVRIQSKINETKKIHDEALKHRIDVMQNKIDQLLSHVCAKLAEMESSSLAVRVHLKTNFAESQESLRKIGEQLHSSIILGGKASEQILDTVANKINHIELVICKLYQELEEASLSI